MDAFSIKKRGENCYYISLDGNKNPRIVFVPAGMDIKKMRIEEILELPMVGREISPKEALKRLGITPPKKARFAKKELFDLENK